MELKIGGIYSVKDVDNYYIVLDEIVFDQNTQFVYMYSIKM